MPDELLALEQVWRTFGLRGRELSVVEDLSLSFNPGEAVCLVGESGCGKTTTGKLLAGLLRPSRGQVRYRGGDVWGLRGRAWRDYRLGVQLVHQDPFAALNPTQRVRDILAAPLRHHRLVKAGRDLHARLVELMEVVDLAPAQDLLEMYPHQLSGGQRQRVAIARALTVRPAFIVADEAVSMVDVSIRVSILDTLRRLQTEMGLGVLLITHDLALGRYFAGESGRIGVMYLGRLVEVGPARELISSPKHPYTGALVAAAPVDPRTAHDGGRPAIPIRSAEVPSVAARPAGCAFHPRCLIAEPGLCDRVVPDLLPLVTGVAAACHPISRRYGAGGAVPAGDNEVSGATSAPM